MPLPEGLSSPCIWGGRIFITGHDTDKDAGKLETIALDRATGKVLWRRTAPTTKIERVFKVRVGTAIQDGGPSIMHAVPQDQAA